VLRSCLPEKTYLEHQDPQEESLICTNVNIFALVHTFCTIVKIYWSVVVFEKIVDAVKEKNNRLLQGTLQSRYPYDNICPCQINVIGVH
jgi:hypothetical protein